MEWECTGDRQEYYTDRTLHIMRKVQGTGIQEYHTDGTLQIIRNVQGTDITMNMNGNFTSGHFTQTHTQSYIVAY